MIWAGCCLGTTPNTSRDINDLGVALGTVKVEYSHYNKTRFFIPRPTSLHVFYYYREWLGEWKKSTFVHFMSKLTWQSHGNEMGQQFSWERTCERCWERALLCVVKWSIWIECQVRMSYVSRVWTKYLQKMTRLVIKFIMECTYLYTIRHFYTTNIIYFNLFEHFHLLQFQIHPHFHKMVHAHLC